MDVLLVDDDAQIRHLLGRLLKLSGMNSIQEVANGDEALAALMHFRPELILTDLHMPTMDGVDFVRALRARGDSTPVIMFSGHADPHELNQAMRAGVNDYLAKPIDTELLFSKIDRAVTSTSQKSWRQNARVA